MKSSKLLKLLFLGFLSSFFFEFSIKAMATPLKNYYQILGVEQNATQEEIKRVYKKLALKWHPDKWGKGTAEEQEIATTKFQEIGKVYEVLRDPNQRKIYDQNLPKPQKPKDYFIPVVEYRDHNKITPKILVIKRQGSNEWGSINFNPTFLKSYNPGTTVVYQNNNYTIFPAHFMKSSVIYKMLPQIDPTIKDVMYIDPTNIQQSLTIELYKFLHNQWPTISSKIIFATQQQQQATQLLFNAIKNNDMDLFDQALNQGANVNALNSDKNSPLVEALLRKILPIKMTNLIKKGATVNQSFMALNCFSPKQYALEQLNKAVKQNNVEEIDRWELIVKRVFKVDPNINI